MTSDAKLLEKVRQRLYKLSIKDFNGIYRDTAWQNVRRFIDAIKDTEGVDDVYVWAGEYHNYMTGDDSKSPYRDYKIAVETPFGILGGYIRCCAAGSVKDPFDAYDMLINLYRVKDMSELDENKKKRLKITLEQAEQINNSVNVDLRKQNISDVEQIANNISHNDNPAPIQVSDSSKLNPKLPSVNTNNNQEAERLATQGYPVNLQKVANESKVFKKSQVEEMRLGEMRKKCKRFTKKQLEESFQNPGFTSELKEYLQQAAYHVEMRLNDFNSYCEYIPARLEKVTENFIETLDANQIPHGEPKLEMNNYSDECDFEVIIPILMDIESNDDLYNAVENECGHLGGGLYAMLRNDMVTISGEIKLPKFTDEEE